MDTTDARLEAQYEAREQDALPEETPPTDAEIAAQYRAEHPWFIIVADGGYSGRNYYSQPCAVLPTRYKTRDEARAAVPASSTWVSYWESNENERWAHLPEVKRG